MNKTIIQYLIITIIGSPLYSQEIPKLEKDKSVENIKNSLEEQLKNRPENQTLIEAYTAGVQWREKMYGNNWAETSMLVCMDISPDELSELMNGNCEKFKNKCTKVENIQELLNSFLQ